MTERTLHVGGDAWHAALTLPRDLFDRAAWRLDLTTAGTAHVACGRAVFLCVLTAAVLGVAALAVFVSPPQN